MWNEGERAEGRVGSLAVKADGNAPLPIRLTCNRCGFPVASRAWGCKNPCSNCGTVYPLGDCSD